MPSRKTCDRCQHYDPAVFGSLEKYRHVGECSLMLDSKDHPSFVDADKVSGWCHGRHLAGCYVGPKFGCIHWIKKEKEIAHV